MPARRKAQNTFCVIYVTQSQRQVQLSRKSSMQIPCSRLLVMRRQRATTTALDLASSLRYIMTINASLSVASFHIICSRRAAFVIKPRKRGIIMSFISSVLVRRRNFVILCRLASPMIIVICLVARSTLQQQPVTRKFPTLKSPRITLQKVPFTIPS